MLSLSSEPTILFSFIAGVVSFLSPCMLPVIPAFIAHMAGVNLDEEIKRKKLFLTAFMFVLGFSVVFALLGVAINSFLESVGSQLISYLSIIAGFLIIIFGAHLSKIIEFSPLKKKYGTGFSTKLGSGYFSSFILGGAFAVGWTPCVGPILGSIFALASASPAFAFIYLVAYSVGIGLPFLIVGAFPNKIINKLQENIVWVKRIRKVFGYIMIILGILVMTQKLSALANLEIINRILL